MKTAIVYKEGKAFLITEMPEEPKYGKWHYDDHDNMKKSLAYQSALQSAISSAIEIAPECQGIVKELMQGSEHPIPISGPEPNKPYIVEGIEWEKDNRDVNENGRYKYTKVVAFIRLSNSEVGNTPTCGACGKPLTKVRPGKEQCDNIKCPSNAEVGKEHQDNIEMITGHPDRNWEEDFSHENGKYINRCYGCELHFMGHKRRTRCKKCCVGKEETEKEPKDVIDFATWYSGMERNKVINAYKRYKNEVIRRKNPTV
jgi:hypothetical protein